ncbi:MAG: hypothetical protein IJC99_02385 [Clostridia bacterium]|nr:hypothetical protein [Clostridia bacterium]
MREHEREEKLEAHDIRRVAPDGSPRPPRKHGKVYRWLDNFWYHHKWLVIGGLFISVVLLVCILQMCGREEEPDVTVVMAGPYSFTTDEAGLTNLQKCLATYLAEDINGDDSKTVKINYYSVYSEQEIKDEAARVDEEGNPIGKEISTAQNAQEYDLFRQYLTTGDAAIVFVSPWLFEEYSQKSVCLADVSAYFGETPPAGAAPTVMEDGSTRIYGVRLADTALWRENSAVRNALPENTYICLMQPGILGNNSDVDAYNAAVAFYLSLTK